MSRLQQRLEHCAAEGRAALIPYLTGGDPEPAATPALMHALVEGGADILELGVPFTDPMADGPTIQLACERALAAGTTVTHVLDAVRTFRERDADTPVVLMGYLNPMIRSSAERFCADAADAGVDGVLAVDLTVEEADTLQPALQAQGLDCIFLLAPTTSPERARRMSETGSGYLYYVSLKGVTGSAALDAQAVADKLASLREVVTLPLAVGFGIRDAADAEKVAASADGVVVGSALVELIAKAGRGDDTLPATLRDAAAKLRQGVEAARARR